MSRAEHIRAWAEAHPDYDHDLTELPEELSGVSEAEIMALLRSDPSFTLLQVTLAVADAALDRDEAIVRVLDHGISTANPSVMGEYYRVLALRLGPDAHLQLGRAALERDPSAADGVHYWLSALFEGHFPERVDELRALREEYRRR